MAAQIDPVCGMQVDEQAAAGRSEYKARNYYFCSAGCKQRFDQEPEHYVSQSGVAQDAIEG